MPVLKISLVLAVLVGILITSTASASEHPWKPRINKNGIQVFTRPVDGAAILEFKADVMVAAAIKDVTAIFEDVEKIPSWFFQCTASKLIAEENAAQKILHIILHLPWPVTERDCVFRITKAVDTTTGTLTYTMAAIPEAVPADPKRIRVPYLKATWQFTPTSDGRTKIDFQQHSDPGGFIPTFLTNSIVVDMPYNSLKDLRALAQGKAVKP